MWMGAGRSLQDRNTYLKNPVAQARDGLSREAPRFAPIQQHRQNTTSVNLPFEPLRHTASTEEMLNPEASATLYAPGKSGVLLH